MKEGQARRIVAERCRGLCEGGLWQICDGKAQSIHHRRKPGRVWEPSNLLALCGSGTTGCHGWIEANPAHARSYGLWIMAGDGPPETVPVLMRTPDGTTTWRLLDNMGLVITVPAPITDEVRP